MKSIIKNIESNTIKEKLAAIEYDEWIIKINRWIDDIIGSHKTEFSMEYCCDSENETTSIKLEGLLKLITDHKITGEITAWEMRCECKDTGAIISFRDNYIPDSITAYVTDMIEFAPFFSSFGYNYRKIKSEGKKPDTKGLSFVFDNSVLWKLEAEECYFPFHYQTATLTGRLGNQEIVVGFDEDEYSIEYHNKYGIYDRIPNNIYISNGKERIPIIAVIKEKVLDCLENDETIDPWCYPDWLKGCKYFQGIEGYEIGIHDFIVKTTSYKCAHHGHELERINALVKVNTGSEIKTVSANAMYCRDCKEYYLSEEEYKRIKRIGTLCHKIVTEEEYLSARNDYSNWEYKSLLSSYGYSANENDDLSDTQRHSIIDFVIDNNLWNAKQVLSHIEWLIRDRGHRCTKAAVKWKNDVEYVKGLMGSSRDVSVGKFYVKNVHTDS